MEFFDFDAASEGYTDEYHESKKSTLNNVSSDNTTIKNKINSISNVHNYENNQGSKETEKKEETKETIYNNCVNDNSSKLGEDETNTVPVTDGFYDSFFKSKLLDNTESFNELSFECGFKHNYSNSSNADEVNRKTDSNLCSYPTNFNVGFTFSGTSHNGDLQSNKNIILDETPEDETFIENSGLSGETSNTEYGHKKPEKKKTFHTTPPLSPPTSVSKTKSLVIKPVNKKITKKRKPSTGNKSRTKRPKPHFENTAAFFQRIQNHWNIISKNPYYKGMITNAIQKYTNESLTIISPEGFLSNIISPLLPNNVTIEVFNTVQGIDGWKYYVNKKRQNEKLALRWCGQYMNYYDPFIYRDKISDNGEVLLKQAMCPYCPLNENTDLDNIFHTTVNSLYMHHLCKTHGVYSTGYEMEPPLFVNQNGLTLAICTSCGEPCKVIGVGNGLESCLISYFRHCISNHNIKKQNRTDNEKEIDKVNMEYKPDALFENFQYEEAIETNTTEVLSEQCLHGESTHSHKTLQSVHEYEKRLDEELGQYLKAFLYPVRKN